MVLFLELHPLYGLFVPLTSLLRGYYLFAFLRWALNFTSLVLYLVGQAILLPNYRKACCYGLDALEGDEEGGHCDADHARTNRGFFLCDETSDTHKLYLKVAAALITVSGCLQLCNILTIE